MHYTKEAIDSIGFSIIEKTFKNKLPSLGFNVREPQLEMVKEILEAVKNENKCLVVEAGVGTGKTFGYLIPLLTLQKYDRSRFSIIVSTGTISLQEQLIRDIKFLIDTLKLKANLVLAKGKTHFICLARMERYFAGEDIPHWTNYSMYGDRADLENIIPDMDKTWENINVQDCKFKDCDYYEQCGFIKLRETMKQNNSIIITNHDQLIANAKNIQNDRLPLFPNDTDFIVIDEAHNLEEKARNALTESWSERKIYAVIKSADNYLYKFNNYAITKKRKLNIEKLVNKLFQKIENSIENEIIKNQIYETQKFPLPTMNKFLIQELINELNLHNISLQLIDLKNDELDTIIKTIEKLILFINSLISDYNKIFWCELSNSKRNKLTINSVPKKLNKIIYDYFFTDNKPSIILTSATISQPGIDVYEQYDYLLTTLGVDLLKYNQLALSKPKHSPFNYEENTILYIPANLPDPRNIEIFREKAINEIIKLLTLTEGKSMILFTSKSDMNFVFSQLNALNLPWNILIQNEGSSQDKIKQEFINDENSILLSTGSFWEGIDIPGTSLSNLIIFKLPFPVPDPILEYKNSISSNGFLDVYLPEMLIRLRQGLGRLIRKESDKGIATILDSRISKSKNRFYRTSILNSLMFTNVTEDFHKVSNFVRKNY
ncbi:ATP-dependent DNA helicase [Bacillus cereus]|uniref:ATP-dependent DNA helicase n=3 Tax=Bacillus cereus TaxID=1396 RepID=UPI002406A383|nr:ATP-dependent DNA helicase [Bacillus cereus]MDF9596630.1 ATP-dependent DNA helicase [Bacillus cereus]MDF9609787.1 ATP-dependent DNA helicase [Bacillus cereus]MDF9661293.1 ATP-dependent DNA helicase [Bacillus cereus]